jgi:NitT/TauT family transport system substrate-binding protein
MGIALLATACGDGGAGSGAATPEGGQEVTVVIGYQSKTINTVTAGTLLRDLGLFEDELAEIGAENGNRYEVVWQDFPSGPPITAEMLAAKVDIGSMGDYPALVNAEKTKGIADAETSLVSITGYNRRGSLNGIVVPLDSEVESLEELAGRSVSVPFGSAAHGMAIAALDDLGQPSDFVNLVNQQPEIGATAIEAGQVDAVAGFVPWPDLLVFRGVARKVFDGGDTEVPTMHGVLMRRAYTDEHPEVAEAFLHSQLEATRYLYENPLEASKRVANAAGLDVEVVYLFNGPNGVVTFDPTLKDEWVDALEGDVPFLQSLGSLEGVDVDAFVDDTLLRQVYGEDYDDMVASFENPAVLSGEDEVCSGPVEDQSTASEAWLTGEETTRVSRTPSCLLQLVGIEGGPDALRVGYVPDTGHGTRTLAAQATWVEDPDAEPEERFLPFATLGDANAHVESNGGTRLADFAAAVEAAS